MDIIWRVENNEGYGCYRDNFIPFISNMIERHDRSGEKHPLPQLDNGINRDINIKEICGFRNLSQAKDWFSQYELKELSKLGFELKEVEVKEIIAFGKRQVIAIR